MPHIYPFRVEVAAELGMFARPDTGSEPCSYVVPTQSAAKGIVESICRIKGAQTEPVAAGICFTPHWTGYSFNSYSPLRKNNQIVDENSCQIRATALLHPRFVIVGVFHNMKDAAPEHLRHLNHAHSAQIQMARRIRRGQFHSIPVMGWKDFPVHTCTVQRTSVQPYNTVIPTFATGSFHNGLEVSFAQDVPIRDGVVHYTDEKTVIRESDGLRLLTFASPVLARMLQEFTECAQ